MIWTMVGQLRECVLLNYRTPARSVEGLLPDGLELVRRGDWAFWNVVVCRVEAMRPAGLEAVPAVGVSYHHVAYRLLVQAMTEHCDVRRGLYFVRSDADAALLGAAGNRLSDFKFHRAEVQLTANDERFDARVSTADDRAPLQLAVRNGTPVHPIDSAFPTLNDAQRFLKYQPLGLSRRGPWLRYAEVFRDEAQWKEEAVSVEHARLGFFETLGQTDTQLELATRIAALPYRWRLGRRERLLVTPRKDAVSQPSAAVA